MNEELSIFAAARAAPAAIGLSTDERAWTFAELAQLTGQRLRSPDLQTAGEKVIASRLVRFAGGGQVGSYLHLGGKIGVLVEFAGAPPEAAARDEFRTVAKEVAMQVAAASPQYARREDIPAEALEREKAVYLGQLEGSKKPANVIEKIIEGKLGSFYEQVVLPDQPSIRDPNRTVAQMMVTPAKTLGTDVRVTRFARLRVGEAS